DEWPQQPGPDCSLMISAVALRGTAGVAAAILRVARRQGAQPIGCEQVLLHLFDDRLCPLGRQHAVSQTDSQDLVRANGCVRWRVVHDIVQASGILIPEQATETPTRNGCHVPIAVLAD